MNQLDITERLIRAVEIENCGNHVGPMPLRAQRLPYVHSQADMNGWGKRPGEKDQLRKEDADAHAAHRDQFFADIPTDPRSVSEAEEAWAWLSLVPDDDKRAALAGWAGCMADNKRRFFKDWCRRHGISEKTGRKRKDAAVSIIFAQLVRSDVQNSDNGSAEGLPDEGENGDESARMGNAWRNGYLTVPGAAPDFSWAEKRSERRRQIAKAAKRKQKAAA